MSEKITPDLSGLSGMMENWLATQKKFAPSGQIMAQMAEALRTISQAQIEYNQTVMRANAAFLAAVWEAGLASAAQQSQAVSGLNKAGF